MLMEVLILSGLTKAEVKVAKLVAKGLANPKEITCLLLFKISPSVGS